jgi:hypothetical protein
MRARVLTGRGAAMFCTYHKGCGALPTHRIRYVYPTYVITFGACHLHATRYGRG